MEDKKIKVCRLCLNVISDKNYVHSDNWNDLLETVFSKKMNVGGDAICLRCHDSLVFCYKLKNKLLETSICRKGFIKSECFDDNSQNNLENTKIKLEINELCCLCLKTCDRSFEMDSVYLKTILDKCFPEIVETQSCLVLCKNCSENVEKAFIFIMACLESDNKIQEFCIVNDKKVNEKLNLFEVSQFVLNWKNTDIDLGVLKDASSDNKTIIKEEPHFVGDNNIEGDINERNTSEPDAPIKVKKYKCDLCQYTASYRWQLKRHSIIHLDKSEIPMHSCEICPFKTKHKYHLNRHLLRHKDSPKMPIFRCTLCPYESHYRENFEQHVRKHSQPLFRCDICPYNTYIKGCYNKHMLVHENVSEIVVFKEDVKCESYPYVAESMLLLNSKLDKQDDSK